MKRIFLLVLAALLLVLAACSPRPEAGDLPPTAEAEATEIVEEATAAPTPESVEEEATAPPTVTAEADPTEAAEAAGAAGSSAAPDLDEIANFPAATVEEAMVVRAIDHVKGAEDPLVQVIEYGDFQ